MFQVRFPRYNSGAFLLAVTLTRWKVSEDEEPLPPVPLDTVQHIPNSGTVYWIVVKPPSFIGELKSQHVVIVDSSEKVVSAQNVIKVVRMNRSRGRYKYIDAGISLGLPKIYQEELKYLLTRNIEIGKYLTLVETNKLVENFFKVFAVPETPINSVYSHIESFVKKEEEKAVEAIARSRIINCDGILVVDAPSHHAYVREAIFKLAPKTTNTCIVIRRKNSQTTLFVRGSTPDEGSRLAQLLGRAVNGRIKGENSMRPVIEVKKPLTLEEVAEIVESLHQRLETLVSK